MGTELKMQPLLMHVPATSDVVYTPPELAEDIVVRRHVKPTNARRRHRSLPIVATAHAARVLPVGHIGPLPRGSVPRVSVRKVLGILGKKLGQLSRLCLEVSRKVAGVKDPRVGFCPM